MFDQKHQTDASKVTYVKTKFRILNVIGLLVFALTLANLFSALPENIETISMVIILSGLFLVVSLSFTIRCKFCGTGWFKFPKGAGVFSKQKENWPKQEFSLAKLPDACPNCDAKFI